MGQRVCFSAESCYDCDPMVGMGAGIKIIGGYLSGVLGREQVKESVSECVVFEGRIF